MSALPQASFGERVPGVSYTPRPSAYGVIVRGAEVLLVEGAPGGWFFPGGGLEPDEPPEAGVEREIMEELGCRADVHPAFAEATQLLESSIEAVHFELQATFHGAVLKSFAAGAGEHATEWVPIERASSILRRAADCWALDVYLRR